MYSTWRVKELKDELKKRSASLQGKKADLIERLELYDQNFNFGLPECVDINEPRMQLPPTDTYRDVNSDTILPPLDKTMIRHYLGCTEKKMARATQLYETHHLLIARSAVIGSNTFLKGYCAKTMKNLQYEVNIKLNENGNPEESNCECPAGSGTNAICKHVAVLLLYTFKDLKVIFIEKDNYFINAMLKKLDSFFPIIKEALFEKYIYYNYKESF